MRWRPPTLCGLGVPRSRHTLKTGAAQQSGEVSRMNQHRARSQPQLEHESGHDGRLGHPPHLTTLFAEGGERPPYETLNMCFICQFVGSPVYEGHTPLA